MVQALIDSGHGFVECQKHFGFSHTAWIKALKTAKIRVDASRFPDRRRRYDWAEIQRDYDQGHTYRECRRHFGFESMSWYKARQRGEIVSRPVSKPIGVVIRTSKSPGYIKAKRACSRLVY